MAVTTTIPPQAYTRDTLVKAIEWIATQPATVRERASSADLLVSFYLQAARKSAAQMEAPVSQENFKSDLKHLAEDLKRFEEPAPSHTSAPAMSSRSPSYGYSEPVHTESIYRIEPPPLMRVEVPPPPRAEPTPPQATPRPESPKGPVWNVDPRSLAAARELQQRLNLGSEVEALRMLVTLGAERARDLFGS